jgi:hypothetical protein
VTLGGKKILALIVVGFMCAIMALSTQRAQCDEISDVVAARAREVLSRRCFQCHGMDGIAPRNIFVLDRERLVASRAVVPGDSNSLLLKVVESGAMPLGGPPLTPEEKAILQTWVASGAPSWERSAPPPRPRVFISDDSLNNSMLRDLSAIPERSRRFVRYFSLSNLYNAGASDAELETTRTALSKLINSLSWHPQLTPPVAVDKTRTLLRIDLRDYTWTAATWSSVLALYPYGIKSAPTVEASRMTGTDISCLRADWFVATASVPPLYYEILELPRNVSDLERRLGVDVSRNLAEEKNVCRAGIRDSGVSQNNRVVERHVSAHGAYWRSYDFRSNLDDQNIFRDPINLHPAGGEIIFNLPNGLQAYYLADGRGRRLDRAPVDIVADRNNPDDPVIQAGRSCISCHFAGIRPVKDDVRAVFANLLRTTIDRNQALALYPSQTAIDGFVQLDEQRFASAIARLGIPPAAGAALEPVSRVARSFDGELTINEAAAEAGLQGRQFQSLISTNDKLTALGFSQLLVSGGGMKRDAWDRHFGDMVQQLQLGEVVTGRELFSRLDQGWQRHDLTKLEVAGALGRAVVGNFLPQDVVRSSRTVFIMSRSVFFKPEDLATALARRTEWQRMRMTITTDRRAADLIIQVDRAPFTTEFPYIVVDARSSAVICSGRVNSLFGTAAGKIAGNFVRQLAAISAGRAQP